MPVDHQGPCWQDSQRELALINAAEKADWQQVVLNGGPPCFHLEGDQFCLRAQRWQGHGTFHPFVPLSELIASCSVPQDVMTVKCSSCQSSFDVPEEELKRIYSENFFAGSIRTGGGVFICRVCAERKEPKKTA